MKLNKRIDDKICSSGEDRMEDERMFSQEHSEML